MFALRPLGAALKQQTRSVFRKDTAQTQQKRLMSGGEDDGVHRVNWWDAPNNPDIWKKHQLAWWTASFYVAVGYLATGGSKKEAKEAK